MDASMVNVEENKPSLRVSVFTRLISALSYTIPAIGGALSSILLIRLFQALRTAESAGISVLMSGMKEASLPVIVSLYLAAICGFAVIVTLIVRMITQTKTATPPFWFFVIGGILCLLPAGLFWKAELLVLEVLSPGSSVGAGGIASVASDISLFLILSIVAALVVFILLIVASVLPLSSRSKPKWGPLIAATAIEILLIALAIAIPFLIDGPKRKNEIANLPTNVKYSDSDPDIDRDTSMVLTLTSDNKLSERQSRDLPDKKVERTENIITREELPEKLRSSMEDKTPDKRIVYFKCDVNATFENVLQVFDILRKGDIDKVGLVVVGEKNEANPYQTSPLMFEVKLALPIGKVKEMVKPDPLTLVAMLEKDGKLRLNLDDMGMISDTKKLENKLAQVFKYREDNGAFREGTNEIEKTVFLNVSKSSKYSDFIKLVETVKVAGARPISIQIDNVNL